MSLISPTGRPRSFRTSRPSSTTSISSDGYCSEVFDGEELEEEHPISFAVSSLINSTNFDPSPMTSTFPKEVTITYFHSVMETCVVY